MCSGESLMFCSYVDAGCTFVFSLCKASRVGGRGSPTALITSVYHKNRKKNHITDETFPTVQTVVTFFFNMIQFGSDFDATERCVQLTTALAWLFFLVTYWELHWIRLPVLI